MKRYKRGLGPNDTAAYVRQRLKEMEETCVTCSVLSALVKIMSIPTMAVLYCSTVWVLAQTGIPAWALGITGVLGYIVTITLIARQQRAMEVMVHDASHGCWHSESRWLNDLLADWIVAIPVLSRVSRYWSSHRPHHGLFGGDDDPCRKRFEAMGLGDIDLSTSWKITVAVLRWLPQYNAEYYKEIGSLTWSQLAEFVMWHTIVFVAPLTAILMLVTDMMMLNAIAVAFACWVIFWMIPETMPLPIIRSIAESEEHDYERGETEYDTTYTNTGFWHRILFHPAGDAYHLIHHMYPNIPTRLHYKVHKLLMEYDPKYRASLHRTQILQKI